MPSRITNSLDKRLTLIDTERRFRKAVNQVVLLNKHLGEVHKRYKMAKRTSNHIFLYNLRMKLAVIDGARSMYYDYAKINAEKVAELRREIASASDSDYSSDS